MVQPRTLQQLLQEQMIINQQALKLVYQLYPIRQMELAEQQELLARLYMQRCFLIGNILLVSITITFYSFLISI